MMYMMYAKLNYTTMYYVKYCFIWPWLFFLPQFPLALSLSLSLAPTASHEAPVKDVAVGRVDPLVVVRDHLLDREAVLVVEPDRAVVAGLHM